MSTYIVVSNVELITCGWRKFGSLNIEQPRLSSRRVAETGVTIHCRKRRPYTQHRTLFPPFSMFQALQHLSGMPRARSLRSSTLAQNAASSSFSNDTMTPASRPISPTFSEMSQSTNISQINFGAAGPEKIITRADLKTSLSAYDNVSG